MHDRYVKGKRIARKEREKVEQEGINRDVRYYE